MRSAMFIRVAANDEMIDYNGPEGRSRVCADASPRIHDHTLRCSGRHDDGSVTCGGHPEHRADALRRSGALGDARVRDVVVESSRATIVSQIIRLRLFYDGAAATHPGRLFSRPACLIAPVASGMRVARKPFLHVGCRRNGGTSLPAPL